jgi:hypothetical protein
MEQMRAKVELIGALTHEGRGRRFERNKPQILTKPSDIAYYKAQSEFSVTMLAVPAAAKPAPAKPGVKPTAAKPGAKPAKPAPAPEPEDTEESEDTEEPEDDGEDTDAEESEESTDDSEEAAEEQEASPVFKKADLEAMTKAALVELAKDHFGLTLNGEHPKPKLVGEILKAQIARASAEG